MTGRWIRNGITVTRLLNAAYQMAQARRLTGHQHGTTRPRLQDKRVFPLTGRR
jgi:hypothetical protein